ncbi:MAG: cereblon family protein [Magnetospirillum sp. WYHS-4]
MFDFSAKPAPETATDEREERLYCAACGREVTRGRWRVTVQEDHEHTFFNPAGMVFRIGCFREAPGASPQGEPSTRFTWFRGYRWRIAVCGGCREHLGWLFTGVGEPPAFFALILGKLTATPGRP